MIFYHGTDVDSALHILNEGLNAHQLSTFQMHRSSQVGRLGWYTAFETEVAWFFASLAPGNMDKGFAVIELELAESLFTQFVNSGQAIVNEINNVPFMAEQVWFDRTTFPILNDQGVFRPSRSEEKDFE